MPQSISDMLRKEIRKELSQGADYSTTAKRNVFHEKFLKRHHGIECDRTTVVKIFKEIYEELGVDLYSVGLSRKKKYNEELASKIKQQHKKRTESAPPKQTPEPLLQIQDAVSEMNFDYSSVESTSATIRCLFAPLEAKYPGAKLSDSTIEQLGQMWHPSVQRCESEMIRYIVIPALATLVLLGSHAYTGYCIKKQKDSQTDA